MKKLFLLLFAVLTVSGASAQIPDTAKRPTYPYFESGVTPTPKTPLTIDAVKALISFPKQSEIYKSLTGLCDVWYDMARQEGKTVEQAAEIALVKLGEKVGEMAKW